MNNLATKLLFWAPRALCIVFAIFLSLFALDVFGEGLGFWKSLVALIIHLSPAGIVLAVLLAAWRWEWLGTAAFAGLGLLYAIKNSRHPDWILVISGPLFVIAALFLISWLKCTDRQRSTRS